MARRSRWKRHLGGVFEHLADLVFGPRHRLKPGEKIFLFSAGLLLAGGGLAFYLGWVAWHPGPAVREQRVLDALIPRETDFTKPVRAEPTRFPARTTMPNRKEELVSGALIGHFSARHDLIRVDDTRVWWESDHDKGDTEEDRLMHRAMEESFRRLVELVVRSGGTLKVQDIYREQGIHAPKSLHREGRAIDVTCDELGLERLAKLAWAAGFDWVYHEWPKNGGAHVHASVRADRATLAPSVAAARTQK